MGAGDGWRLDADSAAAGWPLERMQNPERAGRNSFAANLEREMRFQGLLADGLAKPMRAGTMGTESIAVGDGAEAAGFLVKTWQG